MVIVDAKDIVVLGVAAVALIICGVILLFCYIRQLSKNRKQKKNKEKKFESLQDD